MDFIGIAIFILFIVLRALGQSNKQAQRRQARPPVGPPGTTKVPVPERPQPAAEPAPGLPPIFQFPWEVDWEEVKPVEQPPAQVSSYDQPRKNLAAKQTRGFEGLVSNEGSGIGEGLDLPDFWNRDEKRLHLPRNQVQQGIIWAEIIQSPRALRPYQGSAYQRRS